MAQREIDIDIELKPDVTIRRAREHIAAGERALRVAGECVEQEDAAWIATIAAAHFAAATAIFHLSMVEPVRAADPVSTSPLTAQPQ